METDKLHTNGVITKESTGVIVRNATYVIMEITCGEAAVQYDVYVSSPNDLESIVQHFSNISPQAAA